jgi:hypothetical protein
MLDNVPETLVDLKFMTGVPDALDQPLLVTVFPDKYAKTKTEVEIALRKLAELIQETSAQTKELLPSLKLARFGDKPTEAGCLRYDANVLAVSGVEIDYDGEAISLKRAVDDLRKAKITALVYTSSGHAPEKPHWRVLCPTSKELHPSERYQLVSRLNGLLVGGGILDPGSWSLSKDYYFGNIQGSPPCEVSLIEGDYIDQRSDLDAGAIDKPHAGGTSTPSTSNTPPVTNSPQYGIAVLQKECELVADAEPGDQQLTLNNAAFKVGFQVGRGSLKFEFAKAHLIKAGMKMQNKPGHSLGKWTEVQVAKIVEHGLSDGIKTAAAKLAEVKAEAPQSGTGGDGAIEKLQLLTLDDLDSIPPPKWLVRGVLVENTLAAIYGPPKSLKSFMALDFAMRLATGTPWCSMPVKRRAVLYICAEGSAALRLRVAAWRKENKPKNTADIRFITRPVNLSQSAEVKALIDEVNKHKADGFSSDLIIVDTLARCAAGVDENSAQDMGVVIDNSALLQQGLSTSVLLVHHCGKDETKGMRGSSALFGAVDTLLRVTRDKDGNTVELLIESHKDAEDGQRLAFKYKVVELPIKDEDGHPCTSLVLNPVDAMDVGVKAPSLSDVEQQALDILTELMSMPTAPHRPDGSGK